MQYRSIERLYSNAGTGLQGLLYFEKQFSSLPHISDARRSVVVDRILGHAITVLNHFTMTKISKHAPHPSLLRSNVNSGTLEVINCDDRVTSRRTESLS